MLNERVQLVWWTLIVKGGLEIGGGGVNPYHC